ncbi:hypothetical protein QJS04_geneDACA012174 [Acorus gramineus]|uniref:Uncharacterized protein n=1 Tax=Acorus gramineus TaxID=55184 RepID=A0AAV9BCM2_ACOGR|nr:hypothetical protein QJS04_geneDACA012174 [Acorus gramineus]
MEKLQRVLSLSPSTAFGRGDGSVKALSSVDNCVFTAHQDRQIRVWEVSCGQSENVFRLIATLPTKRDYLGRCALLGDGGA